MSSLILPGKPSYFVTDRLAIGDIASRYIPGWTTIVTCCDTRQIREAGYDPASTAEGTRVVLVPFPDGYLPPDMEFKLRASRAAIGEALQAGGWVLVHCGASISRSPFVAMDYLMFALGMLPSEALAFIRRSHPGASPAEVFVRYLARIHRVEERAAGGPRVGEAQIGAPGGAPLNEPGNPRHGQDR